MKLAAMPVRSASDATLNFQQVARVAAERERSVAIARRTAAKNLETTLTAIEPDTVIYDPGKNLGTTGTYTCPYGGVYHIEGTIAAVIVSKEAYVVCSIVKNGAEALRGARVVTTVASQITNVNVSGLLQCAVGDTLALYGFLTGTASPLELKEYQNRFQVFKVA